MSDLIDRQAAIKALAKFVPYVICDESTESYTNGLTDAYNLICQLPSAQPARDIPVKPNETIDRTWGIPHRQAVCPNCDCYLVDVYFIDGSKRKVTYCESCGQAIDWEGWEQDEIDRR